jgi:hypothetical protein
MLLRKIFWLVLLCFASIARAQTILDAPLDSITESKPFTTLLDEIALKSGARFFFRKEWIQDLNYEPGQVKTLGEALNLFFRGTDLRHFMMDPFAVVIVKDPTGEILHEKAIQEAVRQQKKIVSYQIGQPRDFKRGQQVKVNGRVTDVKTKSPMVGTYISVSNDQFTTTNNDGRFSLTLTPGVYALSFSFINYEDKIIDLSVYANGDINLEMEEVPILLDELVVRDRAELTTQGIGFTQLTMQDVKHAPATFGQPDIIKRVQMLPGVTTVGEAALGFNVRGGSVDQNLILHDGMPIFNSAHAFGFLSSFNPESVRDVSFYRGGIPAMYGGRASSVLDISTKDGSYEKWSGNAGIGMITSNLLLDGPIQKDKTSMMVSVRSTYSNWLVHSVKTDYADLSKSNVSFYDATLKLTHKFSDRTKVAFTGYSSQDSFRLTGDTTYQWSNAQASVTVDHQFNSSLAGQFVGGVSSYGYQIKDSDSLTQSQLSYRITSSVLKAGFHYLKDRHKINFGWQLMHYQFDPGTFKPTSPISNAKYVSMDKQYSIENAFYVSDAYSFNEKFLIEGGLRIPTFISFGPASVYKYKAGLPLDVLNIQDTVRYKTGQPIKTYFGIEPRLSFRWMIDPNSSIKIGYNRIYQFLHLISNTTAVTPTDIWQPSGYYFKPQHADQISIGYFRDFREKKYGISAEPFYKSIKNILDFKDAAQLILNRHLETDLLQGKGWSYGIETSISKNTGRITGSLNYTFSRSFRQVAGPTASESINNGNPYPASFDQPHIMNLTWRYKITRRYYFTGNFTYHTGRPVTIPVSAFAFENTTIAYFSGRNQYRIPDYHRLDIAVVFEGNHRRKKRGEGIWILSIYNVYGRKNPYSIFFKGTGSGVPQAYQLSILGSALPSISYNFRF